MSTSCPRTVPEPSPARLKYEWLARLSGVGRSDVALVSMISALDGVSVYVTEMSSVPGYPSSPSGLVYESASDEPPPSDRADVAVQSRLSRPWRPPCRWLPPSLHSRV